MLTRDLGLGKLIFTYVTCSHSVFCNPGDKTGNPVYPAVIEILFNTLKTHASSPACYFQNSQKPGLLIPMRS